MATARSRCRPALPLLLLLCAAISSGFCGGGALASSTLDGKEEDRVGRLPGQDFNVSFAQYAGYIGVGENSTRNLFYWFFEADDDPSSKPLVLWLNGGPGCSSIGYGLAEELGPFHVKKDGKSLYLNPFSWNKAANLLFLDSPVGVGYSYSNDYSEVLNNGDSRTAEDSFKFLKKWFERFPEYKGREFYLTGESYAGHYVPQLAQAINKHHELTGDHVINLQGYMVGNALTDDYHDHYGVFQYLWATGMISDTTYKLSNLICDNTSFIHETSGCDQILEIADNEIGNIDQYSIFTPTCLVTFARNRLFKRIRSKRRVSQQYDPCTEEHSEIYFNLPEVKKALHVSPALENITWQACSDAVYDTWKDSERSVLHIYRELIKKGLRIWMFSGDTDAVIPVTSTRYNVDALELPTIADLRAWYEDDGQVGGWTQVYKGLTFVSVRGAGHEVALHRPKQALTLFKSFLSGSPLPGPLAPSLSLDA